MTEQLLYLSAVSDDPITMFINSQGGHVESGDTIHDVIRFIKPKVKMIGLVGLQVRELQSIWLQTKRIAIVCQIHDI